MLSSHIKENVILQNQITKLLYKLQVNPAIPNSVEPNLLMTRTFFPVPNFLLLILTKILLDNPKS